jgi:DnaJ-domain-containing protein 1
MCCAGGPGDGRGCPMLTLARVCGGQVPDYYKELGVRPDAPPEEIRAAYKRLVLELHPDKTE